MIDSLKGFLKLETASGVILFFMLCIALICANSPLQSYYQTIVELPVQIRVGLLDLDKPLILWVNEGLMAIFFMLLSLEIKREFLDGDLQGIKQLTLPVVAAVGGIVMPALVYFYFNMNIDENIWGWSIPTTTDIALALGLVSAMGRLVPINLKVFLTALSIVDDVLVIFIIAIFYSSDLSVVTLSMASMGIIGLVLCNRLGVVRLAPYVLLGLFLWICVLKSGVHGTIAGSLVGLAIPFSNKAGTVSPLKQLEKMLHPWVAFGVMPVFVFLNADINLLGITWSIFSNPLFLGIVAGLFVGKQLGVFLFSWVLVKCNLANLPKGVDWWQFYGICVVTGIGFTMSLFMSTLAFEGTEMNMVAHQAVLFGSLISALWAWVVLSRKRLFTWVKSRVNVL